MSADCVFCKILDGQIPSMKVYEDDRTLVFMDINPLNAGTCPVATRRPAPTSGMAAVADRQPATAPARTVAVAWGKPASPAGSTTPRATAAAASQPGRTFP